MKMKKLVSVILVALFAVNFLHAQTTEALTNTTIIKMVKAKLSDDLIIDEINTSKVNFDLSAGSLTLLSNENVSGKVIQAMKAANAIQNQASSKPIIIPQATPAEPEKPAIIQPEKPLQPQAVPVKDNLNQPEPQNTPAVIKETPTPPKTLQLSETAKQPAQVQTNSENSSLKGLSVVSTLTETDNFITIENPAFSITAMSYVNPLTELIPFFNSEFSSLSGSIQEWDKKTRASQDKENQNTLTIKRIEKELTDKKNADAKPFSKEIIELKKNLALSWEKQKTLKKEMILEEKNLIEELTKVSAETDKAIDTKYKEVIKNINSSNPDPSKGENAKTVNIPKQTFNSKVTDHFVPVTMMLVCYQNEIIALQGIIAAWNDKVLGSIQKDADLRNQLEPLQNELTQYMATSKQDQKLKKKEISALKKQCDNIGKERKQLAKQMEDDSGKLAEELTKMKTEVQGVVKERFTDIIENIQHSYQDKFNL
jgi:hypothetical protein